MSPKDLPSARLVQAIRTRRNELGYSQEYMAAKLYMGQNCYSKIELGLNKLTVDRLFAICTVLGVTANELLGDHHDHSTDLSKLFYLNDQPMWMFEPGTAKFLDVNTAATKRYGYSRADFLTMTLFDIRSRQNMHLLRSWLRDIDGDTTINNVRHLYRDGSEADVEIVCYQVGFKGREAYLVTPKIARKQLGIVEKLNNAVDLQDGVPVSKTRAEKKRINELRALVANLDDDMSYSRQEKL